MSTQTIVGLVIDEKYRLEQKIGEGGMGAVYLGTQLMVDRKVAIKLLHAGLNGHDKLKKRFEVEAKAIGRLHHPNCITLFDFGFSRELEAFFTVMEYLDGEAMHKRVVYGVGADEAIQITRQIAMALDHAHHQGILHRDLKPENIVLAKMTDGSELVKVLDFGIARIFRGDDKEVQTTQQQNRLTQAGEVFGTPAYISPEQARGERDLSPASDLYSLGVMLFEMLEGRLPFWGDTAIDTIMKHITEPVPAITRIDVPDGLRQVCYRLLSKDPKLRYQSGKELVDELVALERAPLTNSAQGTFGALPTPHQTIQTGPPSSLTQDILRPHHLADTNPNEWEEAGATVVDSSGMYARPIALSTPQHITHNTLVDPIISPVYEEEAPASQGSTRIAIALFIALFLVSGGVIAALLFAPSDSGAGNPVATRPDTPPETATPTTPTLEPAPKDPEPPKPEVVDPPKTEPKVEPEKVKPKPRVKPRAKRPKKNPPKKTTVKDPPKAVKTPPKKPPKSPKKLGLEDNKPKRVPVEL